MAKSKRRKVSMYFTNSYIKRILKELQYTKEEYNIGKEYIRAYTDAVVAELENDILQCNTISFPKLFTLSVLSPSKKRYYNMHTKRMTSVLTIRVKGKIANKLKGKILNK